ncbi:transcriptional regulator, HxlR family [Methanoregula boonei 6A8]|jgi:DNA-binding HxlR family transcriptional regulator|uniref:Transcriptional regulator, HxlR family n=1 Tax=Methanoregula boonei (strain DSM 21154 / JCM 14090 / 6A8) TaxID=456442 RepID=A7I6Y4_METB6|nr:helix-turn-helix domain-containing protein [Methanoregula boonei]ABS55495.1 transcriptional regulator, HxlR family [Methanoregula boonei 6A8]
MNKPAATGGNICLCPLFGLLDVVAKKWAFLIIAILGNEGAKGFNELKNEPGRISPKTLSETLKNLERIGLVDRKILTTSPPTTQYSLTGDGQELREHLIPLLLRVSERGAQDLPGCPVRMRKEQ